MSPLAGSGGVLYLYGVFIPGGGMRKTNQPSAPAELLLVEAAEQLGTNPAKVYQMGTRKELVMRYDQRFRKWVVTADSVERAKRDQQREANSAR